MDLVLSDIEVRILGSLIEKGITTPDYYPLTLNALTNACNQKSNRSPVVTYEETIVVRGLETLQDKELAEKIHKADSRVPKYQHLFMKKFNLSRPEIAVMCVLMLRGPQTGGEIRARAERLYKFGGLKEVEEVLEDLTAREEPMVIQLPRQTGRKERRYMHLLSGEPEIKESDYSSADEPATLQVRAENERIAQLEEDVARLRSEFNTLRKEFTNFKSQLE
jgi:uncharacterized protein YceH (UPF0502 family)